MKKQIIRLSEGKDGKLTLTIHSRTGIGNIIRKGLTKQQFKGFELLKGK